MEVGHNKYTLFKNITMACMLSTSSAFAMGQVNFALPMADASWRVSGNPIRCALSLVIPNYGVGYFEQYAAQPPHFILRKWDRVPRPLPARIIVRPPVWKPGGQTTLIGSLTINPGVYGVFLRRDSTLKLLIYLSQGYETTFNYRSELGFAVTVALTPIGFQKPYSRYQRCLGNLLPFNYERVRESIFHFSSDSHELTDENKAQLRRIAQYAAADMQIQVIRVIGYADESGRKGYNNAISQERAQAVQNYLITLGVPEEKLSVTWLGALKPVARNDTEAGRAANRRVVIDLIKK
jgi:outer membrane protein OmpA-like peptidoglycan-associated protein